MFSSVFGPFRPFLTGFQRRRGLPWAPRRLGDGLEAFLGVGLWGLVRMALPESILERLLEILSLKLWQIFWNFLNFQNFKFSSKFSSKCLFSLQIPSLQILSAPGLLKVGAADLLLRGVRGHAQLVVVKCVHDTAPRLAGLEVETKAVSLFFFKRPKSSSTQYI